MSEQKTWKTRQNWKSWGGAAGLLAGGLVAGGVLAGSMTANAAESTGGTSSTTTTAVARANPDAGDPTKSQRPDETVLTGDTATKVQAAALKKYPGATVQRTETDSDGVYEAHLVTADGSRVTVEVDKSFAVTGDEATGGLGGGHGGEAAAGSGSTPPG